VAHAPASPVRSRRSQAERRASTRGRLLDATLACLVERGYADTTTAEIESRAGVSRGARLHHFPTKAGLLSAAVGHLYERIGGRYHAAISRVGPDADRFHAGYRLLWETYADPAFAAVLELWVAARTDPELREALRATSAEHQAHVKSRARAYFPDLARREADGLLESLQAAMTGLAVSRLVFGEGDREEQVLGLVERMVASTFAPERKERT
jgi:AcrR family transcriptional regulator